MRRDRRHYEHTKRSVSWFREELTGTGYKEDLVDYHSTGYASWLIEDVRLRVMPVPGGTNRSIQVYISPADDNIESLIAEGLDARNYWRELPSAAHEFFGMCAATILAHEEAHYELDYFLDAERKPIGFKLAFIPAGSLSVQGGKILQHIPPTIVHRRGLSSDQVEISSDLVLTFRAPEYVRESLAYMMESIAITGQAGLPSFVLEAMRDMRESYFDHSLFEESRNLSVADATKIIGWSGRQMINGSILEYYQLHRQLRFERFLVELRNQLLATLNDGLSRVGKRLGFSAEMKIEGLPTLMDVEAAETRLREGAGKFKEVTKPFLLYS
jgi:hypothetical protein